MQVTVMRNGWVAVDGDARQVDVSDLPAGVEALTYDSERNVAFRHFAKEVEDEVQVRDLEGEEQENDRLKQQNKPILQEPLYKKIRVRRDPRRVVDLAEVQKYINRWELVPPAQKEITPQQQAEIEAMKAEQVESRGLTLGRIQPRLVSDIRNMTRAAYRDWFNANFNDPQEIFVLLRQILFFLIRRVF